MTETSALHSNFCIGEVNDQKQQSIDPTKIPIFFVNIVLNHASN